MDFTNFMEEFGIDKMSEEGQQEILTNLFQILSMRMSLRLGQEMTPEQMQTMLDAYEKGGDGAAEIDRMYPNYDQIFQEEVDKLKNDMQLL